MLQRLHEKVQGWMAWAVVGVVASTFVLFGVSYYANSRLNTNLKATVNGEDITRSDFDSVYRRIKQRTTEINASTEPLLKAQALEQVILDNVMLAAGKKNKFYISTKQVEEAILNNADFKEEGQFSNQRFQQLLSNNMFTQTDYLAVMNRGMINNQLRFSFMGTSFALKNELERYIQFSNQKRDFQYLEINPKKMLTGSKPTLLELNHSYKDNAALYKTPEKASLEYILLSMKEEFKKIKLSKSEVQDYYNENKSNYMTPAQYKIKRIFLRGELVEPTKPSEALQKKLDNVNKALKAQVFEKVSKDFSDDLLAEKTDTPWVILGMLDKRVASVLLDLKLNQVSSPIFTSKGVEYIKVIAIKQSKLSPFDKVKESISKNLKSDKAQQSFQQKAEQLADLSYQNPDNLESVAQPLGLKVVKSELAMQAEGYKAPLNSPSVSAAAFNSDVLNEGNNSQPIQVNEDALVVLRVKDHLKSSLKPFKEVKVEIENQLIFNRQLEKANQLAQKLSSQPAKETKKLLLDNHLSWTDVKNSMRAIPAKDVSAPINDFAFSFQMNKKSNIHTQQLAAGNIMVVQLNKVTDGKLTDVTTAQQALIDSQLASNYGINMYELYVQSLKKQAKVDVVS